MKIAPSVVGMPTARRNSNGEPDRYVSLSRRFSSYLTKIISNDHAAPEVLMLSGAAGFGKSAVLQNEFFNPLTAAKVRVHRFDFRPDDKIYNHSYLKIVIEGLVSGFAEPKGQPADPSNLIVSENIAILRALFKRGDIVKIHDNDLNLQLLDILSGILRSQKIVLIFEDIHFAQKNFLVFLADILGYEGELNLDVICTTRLKREEYKLPNSARQHWMYLKDLRGNDVERYVSLFARQSANGEQWRQQALQIGKGSPFFIKELCLLISESEHIGNISPSFYTALNDRSHELIKLRLNNLDQALRDLLESLSVIGFESDMIELELGLQTFGRKLDTDLIADLVARDFIVQHGEKFCFRHQIIFECVLQSVSVDRRDAMDRVLVRHYFRAPDLYAAKIVRHAERAGLHGICCFFAQRLAADLTHRNQFELVSYYYEIYLDHLQRCSAPAKIFRRSVDTLVQLHNAYLITGRTDKAEQIGQSLIFLLSEASVAEKEKIFSTLTRSYWLFGNYADAHRYARLNVEVARAENAKEQLVGALVRLGSICSEEGDFERSLAAHNEALSLVGPTKHASKFGLFVDVYPNITSVRSICFAELGEFAKARQEIQQSLRSFDKVSDDFTRLFIATHAGFAMTLLGDFAAAHPYLDEGLKIFRRTKASVLGPASLAILGSCKIHLGDRAGHDDIEECNALMKGTSQGHKQGMIDFIYLESLLMRFDVGKFEELIDAKIRQCEVAGQKSYLGWLRFLEAVYFSFFKKSAKGFVGAVAKANVAAMGLDMKLLQQNIRSIVAMDTSRVLDFGPTPEAVRPPFFDRAKMFYALTQSARPIRYHKDN